MQQRELYVFREHSRSGVVAPSASDVWPEYRAGSSARENLTNRQVFEVLAVESDTQANNARLCQVDVAGVGHLRIIRKRSNKNSQRGTRAPCRSVRYDHCSAFRATKRLLH